MLTKLLLNPMILNQACDEDKLPEPAIAIHKDVTGLIILTQEGRDIIIDAASAPELIKAIKLQLKNSEVKS